MQKRPFFPWWPPTTQPWWFLCLALLTAGLVACGTISPNPTASSSPGLRVLGTLTGAGETELAAVFAPFTQATGIPVIYEGTDAFDTVLPVRVEAGDPPDFALFPQLGLMQDLADRQQLIALDFLDPAALSAAFKPDIQDLGRFPDGQGGDRLYGFSIRTYLKSLVWYRPDVLAAQGQNPPATWEDLTALGNALPNLGKGSALWCLGLESGDATGWVGTDWIETLVLRLGGPELYDQWTSHEIPFTHPVIKEAFTRFGAIAKDPRLTLGGSTGAISLSFMDAPTPLFSDPPGCYLHHQANFIPAFFPKAIQADETVDVFPFPAIDPAQGRPVVVADLLVGMLKDSPAGRQLLDYLLTPQPQEIWAGFGGHLSPHQQVQPSAYPDELSRREVAILAQADGVRYDGSALMPSAVDRSFASGVVDYLSGVDLDQVLRTIEASWSDL